MLSHAATRSRLLLLGIAGALSVPPVQGQDGPLDPSFGEGGRVILNLGSSTAEDVLIQPDGKVLFVGRAETDGLEDHVVVRLLPDGTFDPTFGDNGVVRTSMELHTVALQEDGSVVAAARGGGFALTRFTPTGTLDLSFGEDGIAGTVLWPLNTSTGVGDVAVQPDGRIVAAGVHVYSDVPYLYEDFIVARYTEDGKADSTFGGSGVVTVNFESSFQSAQAVAVQPDGYIVVAGREGWSLPAFAAVRLRPDGTLDANFGDGGVVTTTTSVGAVANALALLPDGGVVLAGAITPHYYGGYYTPYDFMLARYLPDGTLDTAFGGDGIVATDVCRYDDALDVAVRSDGRLIAVGFGCDYIDEPEHRFAVVGYTADGALDDSFGEGGIAFTSFGSSPEVANAVAVQPDGRIVAAGYTSDGETTAAVLARYLSTPPTPTEEGPDEAALALGQPFPNPARRVVTIPFSTVTSGLVQLVVYDVLGREVAVLAEGQRAGGTHEVAFDTAALPAGVYVLRLRAGDNVIARRLTVVR